MDHTRLLRSANWKVSDCRELVFIEMWLNDNIPGSAVQLELLACSKADRAPVDGGKVRVSVGPEFTFMMPGGHCCMQTLLNISGVYDHKVSPVLFAPGDTHNFDFCNLVRSYIKSILLGPFPVCILSQTIQRGWHFLCPSPSSHSPGQDQHIFTNAVHRLQFSFQHHNTTTTHLQLAAGLPRHHHPAASPFSPTRLNAQAAALHPVDTRLHQEHLTCKAIPIVGDASHPAPTCSVSCPSG